MVNLIDIQNGHHRFIIESGTETSRTVYTFIPDLLADLEHLRRKYPGRTFTPMTLAAIDEEILRQYKIPTKSTP